VVRDNPDGKSKIARRPALNRLSVPSRAWSRVPPFASRAGLSDVADGGDRSTLTVPLLRRALAWTRRNEATRQEGAAHEAIHAHRLGHRFRHGRAQKRQHSHSLSLAHACKLITSSSMPVLGSPVSITQRATRAPVRHRHSMPRAPA